MPNQEIRNGMQQKADNTSLKNFSEAIAEIAITSEKEPTKNIQ